LQQERESYEYIINEGKIIHKQSGEPLDTSQGPKGTKWIFVMSTAKRLYAGKVIFPAHTGSYVSLCYITFSTPNSISVT
jgi:hypothetical protein